MTKVVDESLIFLTYNDKVLLMLRDNQIHSSSVNMWSFIGGVRENNESSEEAGLREVAEQTGLKLTSAKFLTTVVYDSKKAFIYHAILTAGDLNDIKREEGRNLDFFTLPETEKLFLDPAVKMFFSSHRSIIEEILQN